MLFLLLILNFQYILEYVTEYRGNIIIAIPSYAAHPEVGAETIVHGLCYLHRFDHLKAIFW